MTEDRSAKEVDSFRDRIANEIAAPISFQGEQLHVTASIGIATTRGKDVAESVLARADAAMYASKRQRSA